MKKDNFSRSLLVLTLLLAGITGIVQNAQHKFILSNLTWPAILYFYLLTLIIYKVSFSAIDKNNKIFIKRFYSAIGIRLVFTLFPLLIYLLFMPTIELPFLAAYLLLYLFYTAFEIYFLIAKLRPDFIRKSPE